MGEIKITIEVRIEADSEGAARQYALAQGIDVTNAKWSSDFGGKGGRLYVVATTPFPNIQLPAGTAGGV